MTDSEITRARGKRRCPSLAVPSVFGRLRRRVRCRVRGHRDLAVVAAHGDQEAVVACPRCGWLAIAPLTLTGEPPAHVGLLPDSVVVVDAHAFAELQAAYLIEAAFVEVDPW